MEPGRIAEFLKDCGEPEFRGRQILRALCAGVSSYDEITTLPRALRKRLSDSLPMLSFKVERALSTSNGSSHKAVLRLTDGQMIETVLMSPKPGLWSVCVSSQVGCALKCNFCATGLMGFKRNLSAEEITDQVLWWRQFLRGSASGASGTVSAQSVRSRARGGEISNVVYMGMGEPMLNFEAVKKSIERLCDPGLFGFGRRSIAVSTAGVVPGIARFSKECPQVHLALSLHSANNILRTQLMPINKAYPIEDLVKSLRRYFARNKRKVFLEYVLLDGENDQLRHAQELVRFIHRVGPVHLLHVNLIIWNPTRTPHHSSERLVAAQFKRYLFDHGIHVTIRKNLGQEINGACGQLVIPE